MSADRRHEHLQPSEAASWVLQRLRPAKVRVALRRRWFEHRLGRVHTQPAPGVEDLGSVTGGWTVPTGLVEPWWLCYSVGAGADLSFDLELIRRFGVTVRSVEPVPGYVRLARERHGEVPGLTIHQAAITTRDGPLRMQVTHQSVSEAVSAAGLYESHRFVVLPGRTLRSLMAELGDDRVQLLKLDIEGAEYEVLPALDLQALGVEVLAVQLHHVGTVRQARALVRRLGEQGYSLVGCRPAVKLTFARDESTYPRAARAAREQAAGGSVSGDRRGTDSAGGTGPGGVATATRPRAPGPRPCGRSRGRRPAAAGATRGRLVPLGSTH